MMTTTAQRAVQLYEAFKDAGARPVEVVVEGRNLRVVLDEKPEDQKGGLNVKWNEK